MIGFDKLSKEDLFNLEHFLGFAFQNVGSFYEKASMKADEDGNKELSDYIHYEGQCLKKILFSLRNEAREKFDEGMLKELEELYSVNTSRIHPYGYTDWLVRNGLEFELNMPHMPITYVKHT